MKFNILAALAVVKAMNLSCEDPAKPNMCVTGNLQCINGVCTQSDGGLVCVAEGEECPGSKPKCDSFWCWITGSE